MAERSPSVVEMLPMRAAADRYDVAVLGGGLAGLTLSMQIKKRRPATSVVVLEKREGPAPEAAFKVGESTVNIGAWYFGEVVGLRELLLETQLRKAGLRFYMPAGANDDLTRRVEFGPRGWPSIDTYQIDRGRFENDLVERARGLGVDVLDGCRVTDVAFGETMHTVGFEQYGRPVTTKARWVMDASGRASLLKRQLGLAKSVGHTINAAWIRLRGGLDLESWGAHDPAWMARMPEPGVRTFATNHLLGEGYWVWLIPLSSGAISIGVCSDPRRHPWEQFASVDALLEWLRAHEAQLASELEPRTGEIMDYLRVQDFAYGVEQLLSADRWCLVGEAAAFADPFYSPGSDFIALSNTFACDVATRELDGEDVTERVAYFGDYYRRAFEFTLAKYEDQYAVFGNPWVMNPKLGWDVVNLHVPPLLMLNGKFDDLEFMRSVDDILQRFFDLNIRVERLFRDWHALEQRPYEGMPGLGGPVGPALAVLDALEGRYDDDALRARLAGHLAMVEAMAIQIFHKASAALPSPPDDRPLNPYGIGLDPDAWEADGLYEPPGLTLAEAVERAPGVGFLWLDRAPVRA